MLPAGSAGIDLLIVLCGCLRACADLDEFKQQAGRHIIVAGASLEGARYDETQIYTALIAEVDRPSAEAGD
jgi:hypothetical protein